MVDVNCEQPQQAGECIGVNAQLPCDLTQMRSMDMKEAFNETHLEEERWLWKTEHVDRWRISSELAKDGLKEEIA